MTTIAVSELRANLMKTIEEVKQGTQIQITSRGKVVAQLISPDSAKIMAQKKLKKMGGNATIVDIIEPIDEAWESNHS